MFIQIQPLSAITSCPPGPVTTPPDHGRLGAGIMPGLAGRSQDTRDGKKVTGRAAWTIEGIHLFILSVEALSAGVRNILGGYSV